MQLSPSPRPGIPRFNETPPRLPPPLPSPCGFNVPLGRQSSGRYRPLIQQQPCLACSMNKQAVVPSSPADLQKHGMQAVVSLSTQYRMAEDIQLLANTLMYSSALRPGNAAVASAMLHLPHYPRPRPPSMARPGETVLSPWTSCNIFASSRHLFAKSCATGPVAQF